MARTRASYLSPLEHDPREQYATRYVLRDRETREHHDRYARNLESVTPIHKTTIRYCVLFDSTMPYDLPYDNVVLDVLVVTTPLGRLQEMAELVVAMFDPKLEGSSREPPPRKVIFANVLDHMACEGLPQHLESMGNAEAPRAGVARALHRVASDMGEAADILMTRLQVPAVFVSLSGMMY